MFRLEVDKSGQEVDKAKIKQTQSTSTFSLEVDKVDKICIKTKKIRCKNAKNKQLVNKF